MLNKNLKTFSNFLRKEKVSVIIGVSLGVVLTLNSTNDSNLSNNTVTAQAVDAEVLADDDVQTSLSQNTIPSRSFIAKTESEHVTISINEQVIVSQGYDSLASSANDVKSDYDAYVEEQKRKEEEKRRKAEEKRKAEEEAERKRLEELAAKEKTATFKTTGYCNCRECCGQWSPEVSGKPASTASGTSPKAGRTVAVDPDLIPLGSTVIIDGVSYIAEDTGSAVTGNVIDIYFDSHSEACNWGVRYKEVTYIIQ